MDWPEKVAVFGFPSADFFFGGEILTPFPFVPEHWQEDIEDVFLKLLPPKEPQLWRIPLVQLLSLQNVFEQKKYIPTSGNDPIWPNIFQTGWNHQLYPTLTC